MNPPSVIERYFQCRYRTGAGNYEGEDQLILTHSNRVCVICIAESHPIIREKKTVSSVDFNINGVNRLDIKLSGKGKKGAQSVNPNTIICKVNCQDGSEYSLRSCMKGQLVEVNENLSSHPELLTEKPRGTGYLAVVLPYLKIYEEELKRFKTESEYQVILEERKNAPLPLSSTS